MSDSGDSQPISPDGHNEIQTKMDTLREEIRKGKYFHKNHKLKVILEIKKELKMKEGLENLRRALGEKTADRKDIQQQIISSTTTIQGTESLKIFS